MEVRESAGEIGQFVRCWQRACRKGFTMAHVNQRYCSRYCKEKDRKERRGIKVGTMQAKIYKHSYARQCKNPQCGKEFVTGRKERVYCGRACKARHWNVMARERKWDTQVLVAGEGGVS